MPLDIKAIYKKIKLLSKDSNKNYYELLNIYKDLIINYYLLKQ